MISPHFTAFRRPSLSTEKEGLLRSFHLNHHDLLAFLSLTKRGLGAFSDEGEIIS
jgi:hypothetical protein